MLTYFWPYIVTVATFIFLSWRWYVSGRDPEKSGKNGYRFSPPKELTVAEAGVLIDEYANPEDIFATLIELAIRKQFVIRDLGDDFEFELTQDFEDDPGIAPHEQALLLSVFGRKQKVLASEIKEQLNFDIDLIKENLYEQVYHKKYFENNPQLARRSYIHFGIAFFVLALIAPLRSLQDLIPYYKAFHVIIAFFATGMLFFFFGFVMPKKTRRGHELLAELIGLRSFILSPDDKQQGYAEEIQTFERLLPYAIIFNGLDSWDNAHGTLYDKTEPHFWHPQEDKQHPTSSELIQRIRVLQEKLMD